MLRTLAKYLYIQLPPHSYPVESLTLFVCTFQDGRWHATAPVHSHPTFGPGSQTGLLRFPFLVPPPNCRLPERVAGLTPRACTEYLGPPIYLLTLLVRGIRRLAQRSPVVGLALMKQ